MQTGSIKGLWVFISKPVKTTDRDLLQDIWDRYDDLVIVQGTNPLMQVETSNTSQAFSYLRDLMLACPYLKVTVHRT